MEKIKLPLEIFELLIKKAVEDGGILEWGIWGKPEPDNDMQHFYERIVKCLWTGGQVIIYDVYEPEKSLCIVNCDSINHALHFLAVHIPCLYDCINSGEINMAVSCIFFGTVVRLQV